VICDYFSHETAIVDAGVKEQGIHHAMTLYLQEYFAYLEDKKGDFPIVCNAL